ncbi:hypothetical protein O4160_22825 [Rhodococcus sp. IEGM 1401]|uniref:Uncharacterized protein n=2 Tax=Rhodococcus TaxID=1827 RepID=A0ABU4AXI2_9NOCA|nr:MULTISPECIES: hypothetical protein [Rhodococcus]MCZ4563679.1 hypothetical protein [Rhodococcus sp. IEGM 1401]MDI9923801.1 hypothetical protein [Rhodococcus sp. IEGM 1372]MDV6230958.1 hypothetical protein [Rhodococcus cercidiphylli]MDV8036294.1 hypothetical protein [Rhodococcus sp. IEGM 1414]
MRINGDVIYDDGPVRLDEAGVTLRYYYFPFATKKFVPYDRIRAVDTAVLGNWNGRWRLWGASTIDQWLPLDVMRPKKDTAVVLTLRRISPVFTPDDPDQVAHLIRERMTPRA